MLELELGNVPNIEIDIFGDELVFGERVTLLKDSVPIGIAIFQLIDDSVLLHRVGISKNERGQRYGDFFSRSMLYKLSLSGLDIVIPYLDEYYKKFGFISLQNEGIMTVKAEDIVYPSSCKGGNCG